MYKKAVSFFLIISIVLALSSCNAAKNAKPEPSTAAPIPTVKVSIPEGYTLVRISWTLEEKGLCTSEEFLEAAQSYQSWLDISEYPFLADLQNAENVCFYLEGYIFPLTYNIPVDATAKDILKMMLDGTKSRFSDDFLARVSESEYNLHEILTIASIIEKEAYSNEQRPMISSVIHNRLNIGMKIQCDPTVKYCTGVIGEFYPEKLEEYKNYYNTYRAAGLMPGPICNPGMESIEAALSPVSSDNYYFIIETEPPYNAHYSKTYEEHSAKWNEIQNNENN